MNPIVVICTYARYEITSKNIRTLFKQTRPPKIVLVVSDNLEFMKYSEEFPSITVMTHPNNPLGSKWQAGVNKAVELGADPLIITGSDDILCRTFVEYTCDAMKAMNLDFIGLRGYWVHYKSKAHFIEYKPLMPIGGGRVYSRHCLKRVDNIVFNPGLNRHLDDLGWKKLQGITFNKWIVTDEPGIAIHAIKGNWVMKNPFNPHHPNVKILKTVDSASLLPELYV